MAHRGTINQQNKSHKHGRHRTKGELDRDAHGRVNVKQLTKKKKNAEKQADRRNQVKQIRAQKREKFMEKKRQRGGQHSPPHFVVVVSLSASASAEDVVELLKSSVEEMDGGVVTNSALGLVHTSLARFKQRLSFFAPTPDNLQAVMDSAKIADTLLFVTSIEEPVDEQGQCCLNCLRSQGLPASMFVCKGLSELPHKKMVEARKDLNKEIEFLMPGQDTKVQPLDTESDRLTTLRKLMDMKAKALHFREIRPHLVAENVSFEAENEQEGTLKVSGYLRGADLSADRLVHITGWGTYQISQIVTATDPHPLVLHKQRPGKAPDVEMEGDTEVLATPNPKFQEPLQFEVAEDMFDDDEQTWPTQQELDEADDAEKQRTMKLRKKFLAKGFSEYQMNWLFNDDLDDDLDKEDEDDSEEDDDGDEETGDHEMEQEDEEDSDGWESAEGEEDDSKSVTMTEPDTDQYDEEAERIRLQQLQEERREQNNPDEVELMPDMKARERFARYRGLASFRTSPWNANEELPKDYKRIVRLGDIKKLKNRVLKMELTSSVLVGQYLTIHIKAVPKVFYDAHQPGTPLCLFGLLPFEQRMSVLHFVVKREPNFEETLKSKAQLTFQVGFRRFSASTIFSTHKSGDKQLMLRYLPEEGILAMSVYGPLTFGPCPVLVFKKDDCGTEQLIASGSLLSVDPNRLIIKRAVLRGDQFKLGKRKGVVRFMFFNREDIEYFKGVELKTKLNRKGRILMPLGTHGHMKVFFNGQNKSQDVVFMNLYKRVYPKWTYEPETPFRQETSKELEGQAYEMFE